MELLGKRSVAWWIKKLLDVTWFVLLMAVAFVALATVIAILTGDFSDLNVELDVRVDLDAANYRIASESLGFGSATLEQTRGKLTFTNPGGMFAFAVMIWRYIGLAIGIFAVYQMRKIFGSLAARIPFDPANAVRIRLIGLALIGGQLLGAVMGFGFTSGLENELTVEGLALRPDWGLDFFSILIGLIILVIAEVFRIGSRLQAEQDLTI